MADTVYCYPDSNVLRNRLNIIDQNDQAEFIHRLTSHYADLNALHSFREGNGRAQREFARELCCKCGYLFDLTHTNHEEMLNASIKSFYADNAELERIFSKAVTQQKNM